MEIEQSFTIPYSANEVWDYFTKIEEIVTCLPGAALLAPPESGALKIRMTVKLGPIVAGFAGDGEISYDDQTLSGKISGNGADRKSGSRVKGEARFALTEHTDLIGGISTQVSVFVDYAITGALAQFSRGGIIKDIAQRLTLAFAENLKLKIENEQIAKTAIPIVSSQSNEMASQTSDILQAPSLSLSVKPVSAPLNLGNLFWQSLWQRIKKAFGFSRT
jgi:hypothetical protein